LRAIDPRRWGSSIAISTVTSVACHLVFKVWLDVQLPAGPWGFLGAMELPLHAIGYGFSIGLQPLNLFACFVCVFIGTLIGVLPGIGPVATMSMLFPVTYAMTPTASIIMMAGIYYGAMYGGSTTSILANIPGEAASVVTCLDGYQMARQGLAGPALGIAAFGPVIARTGRRPRTMPGRPPPGLG